MCGCRLSAMGGVISVQWFDFRHHGTIFIYVLAIPTSKIYKIKEKKLNQWSSVCYETEVTYILIIIIISNV